MNNLIKTRNLYFSKRLVEAMKGFLDYPLTTVVAPMGYGKTTFVRESLKNIDADILWQKVYDSGVTEFWKGLCHQLENVDQGRALSLAALGFPNDNTTRYEAYSLIKGIELERDTILVIDDYHAVASEETNDFIESLVMGEIPYLHLVLVARHTEFRGMEELKLKGYLQHIGKAAFEFMDQDIKAYFRLCGIQLKETEAQSLYSLTEGWISALYLIMLNYREYRALDTVKDIGKLIENAVYRHFQEETKEMLLYLCMFEGFSLEQAVYVSRNENAGSLLSEVISKNAFVKYDDCSKTYQIHSIFMNFLQDKLERKNMQNDLYQRVGQWFLKIGDYSLAQHYFYLCRDFESAYRALENEKQAGINYAYNLELIVKVFTECPTEIRKKHHLATLALAFEFYSCNEREMFSKACTEFTENLEQDKELTDRDRNRLLGEYQLLLSFTVYNDIRKMSIHHIKACSLLDGPALLLPQAGIWTFGSPSVLYMFYRESGKLDDALQAMFEALPHYSLATGGNAEGGEYCMQAEVYFFRGDFENALIACHQAIHRAEPKKQVSNIICVLFLIARISLMKGNYAHVQELLNEIHDKISESKDYLLLHTADICVGYIYSLLNQNSKIPEWLEKGDYSSNRLLFPNYAMMNIVKSRALLIRDEYNKLIGSMESFIGVASVFPNLLGQIYTYICVAAANWRISRRNEALALLKKALDIAMPDEVYIPFVENCDYIKPLIEELYSEGCHLHGIEKILELNRSYQEAKVLMGKEQFEVRRPKLTEREAEIARLAAEGYSNSEIGNRLFISQNTVKTQLKSVFDKLGISSRVLLKQYFTKDM